MCVSETRVRTPFLQPAARSLVGCPLISGSWRDQTEDNNKAFYRGFRSLNATPTLLLPPRRTSQSNHEASAMRSAFHLDLLNMYTGIRDHQDSFPRPAQR